MPSPKTLLFPLKLKEYSGKSNGKSYVKYCLPLNFFIAESQKTMIFYSMQWDVILRFAPYQSTNQLLLLNFERVNGMQVHNELHLTQPVSRVRNSALHIIRYRAIAICACFNEYGTKVYVLM